MLTSIGNRYQLIKELNNFDTARMQLLLEETSDMDLMAHFETASYNVAELLSEIKHITVESTIDTYLTTVFNITMIEEQSIEVFGSSSVHDTHVLSGLVSIADDLFELSLRMQHYRLHNVVMLDVLLSIILGLTIVTYPVSSFPFNYLNINNGTDISTILTEVTELFQIFIDYNVAELTTTFISTFENIENFGAIFDIILDNKARLVNHNVVSTGGTSEDTMLNYAKMILKYYYTLRKHDSKTLNNIRETTLGDLAFGLEPE